DKSVITLKHLNMKESAVGEIPSTVDARVVRRSKTAQGVCSSVNILQEQRTLTGVKAARGRRCAHPQVPGKVSVRIQIARTNGVDACAGMCVSGKESVSRKRLRQRSYARGRGARVIELR